MVSALLESALLWILQRQMSDRSDAFVRPGQRRFIAGAVCPRCGAMDRIVVDSGTDERSCVSCGFSEARPSGPPGREPLTRVTRGSARLRDTPAEVVSLVDITPVSSDGDT